MWATADFYVKLGHQSYRSEETRIKTEIKMVNEEPLSSRGVSF